MRVLTPTATGRTSEAQAEPDPHTLSGAASPPTREITAQAGEHETQLGAGEEANIVPDRIVKVDKPDVTDTVAWRQRRLVFRADRLADIAAEFNRYNRSPKIVLSDSSLGERRYTGTFDVDDPGALALLLAREKDLGVDVTGEEILIRHR